MDLYRVVYEFYRKTHDGGTTGCRFPRSFANRDEFLKCNSCRPRITRPIARGISAEKVADLLALTPDVCQLTYSVNSLDNITSNDSLRLRHVDRELYTAKINILSRRERRKNRYLVPKPGFPFVDTKPHLGYPVRQTIFQYIKDNLMTADGTIADLDVALENLRGFIIDTYKSNGFKILE